MQSVHSYLRKELESLGHGHLPDAKFAMTLVQMRCRLFEGLGEEELVAMIKGWDTDVGRSAEEISALGERVLALWAEHIGGVKVKVSDVADDEDVHEMTYSDLDSPGVLALDLSSVGGIMLFYSPNTYYSSLISLPKDCPIDYTRHVAMSVKRRIFVTSSIFTCHFHDKLFKCDTWCIW